MAEQDFKTAAAKLLAQHAMKKKEAPPPVPRTISVPSVDSKLSPPERMHIAVSSSAGSELSGLLRTTAIPALAGLGCTIMVFLVPETIFGMWFNVVFGLASGALFGYIIVRELK